MTRMGEFIRGAELSERFYRELVGPLLEKHFPTLPHAAAFLGYGSDVLGYDSPMSADHGWGARVTILVASADYEEHADRADRVFRDAVPADFAGHPTTAKFDEGEQFGVRFETVGQMLRRELLGFEWVEPVPTEWWLTFGDQQLLRVTAGRVFRDDAGELTRVRRTLAYYPDDVWLYLLAAGWTRIGQEEPFVGRAGDAGDELGSAVIAGRLARDVMRLCFLMERTYAPYPKWFGSAFARLRCAAEMTPLLQSALRASNWRDRERALCSAYSIAARMHNALELTEPLPAEPSGFYSRPYRVIHGGRFARALIERIADPNVRAIADRTKIGNVDQFSDSTDLVTASELRPALRQLFGAQGKTQG
jgi:hypothetical protein